MSDAEDDHTDAAQAGTELRDPETMSENQQPQTDAQTRERTQAPAEAITDFAELYPRQVDGHEWRVLSLSNGQPTAYEVDVSALSCTCEDDHYNRDSASGEICKHLSVVIYHSRLQLSVEDLSVYHLSNMVDRVQRATSEIENIRDLQRTMQNATAQSSAGPADSTSERPQGEPDATADESPAVNPRDAAETLQAAYDDVVNDMQVQATASYVWIQTGKDTPDALPGPGNVDPFDAFLKNPDQMVFVPPDADASKMPSGYGSAVSQKPGEWWKNVILPEDVDEYVSEVLE